MSEQGKGSLLLPLGIGAGLLLLLTSMKKKDATETTVAAGNNTALLPDVKSEDAAVPQIDPAPAPSYAQAVAETSDADGGEAAPDEQDGSGEESEDPQETAQRSAPTTDEGAEDDDDSYAASSGSRSGGGSYTPYQPSSSINTNRQTSPLPAPAYNTANTAKATPAAINPKSIRFQSDQAKMLAAQKARNNKSMRFQSDQVKKFAARSGADNSNPLTVGNGKPRMGVRLPVTQRPGATVAAQQAINITSQSATSKQTAPVQKTIFPLRFGTTSPYVKEVQRRLGVSATGYFGAMTKAAIQKRFRVSEISETLYKQIVSGKAPAPVTAMRKPVPKALHPTKKPLPKRVKTIKRK